MAFKSDSGTGGGGGTEERKTSDDSGSDTSGTSDRPTGVAGPDDTPGPTGRDSRGSSGGGGGGGGGAGGNLSDRPTGVAGPEDTPEPADGGRDAGGSAGGDGGADSPTENLRGKQDSPTSGGGRQGGRGGEGSGADSTDEQAQREARAQETPDDRTIQPKLRAARALARRTGGFTRSAASRAREQAAAVRTFATAVTSDPGRGRRDPVVEVNAATDVLEEFSATTRETAGEYGANVEGFDEVGSGAFDVPEGFGGEQQQSAQDVVNETVGEFTDPFAEQGERIRSGIVDAFPGGGGLATAAAAGVVAPEPVSTTGGALILGGLAVGAIAVDTARREGIEVPTGGLFEEQGATPSEPVTRTTIELPDETSVRSNLPDEPMGGPEIETPTTPGRQGGEIGLPEVTASQLNQVFRRPSPMQEEQDRRQRNRNRGANRDELDEILRGPEGGVTIGEETPPSQKVEDDTGRQFYGERDTDPRVVIPEPQATAEQPGQFEGAETAIEPTFDLGVGTLTGSQPKLFVGQQTDQRQRERELLGSGTGGMQAEDTTAMQTPGLQSAQALKTPFETPSPSVASPTLTPPGFGYPPEFADPFEAGPGTGVGTGGPDGPFELPELDAKPKKPRDSPLFGREQRFRFETRDLL